MKGEEMIKRTAVVAAAAAGLVLANAGWAAASSDTHHGSSARPAVACLVGKDAGVANLCGNTNVYSPNILGDLLHLNLLSPQPPYPPNNGGGGGGNN
jgi:hypothetical protein